MKYKYRITGENPGLPSLPKIDCKCSSLFEVENVVKGLKAVGYNIKIEELKQDIEK